MGTQRAFGTDPAGANDPQLGEIVFYNHPGDATGKYPPKQSPAMILAVHPDGTADIRVFTQPSYGKREILCSCGERHIYDTVISGGGVIENYHSPEGDRPFCWTRSENPGYNPYQGADPRHTAGPGGFYDYSAPAETERNPKITELRPRELPNG